MGMFNRLDKTSIIPKYGPGAAGFAVKKSDQRVWSDIDGTQRPLNFDNVIEITADRTLTAVESGTKVHINSTTTRTVTLPVAARGLAFNIFVKAAASSGAGHTLDVQGVVEKVYAKGITAAGGKGLINTQATGAIGDAIHVWSDGTDWFATVTGTWAREA